MLDRVRGCCDWRAWGDEAGRRAHLDRTGSNHSEAINDWEGSGDAVIEIHGPLGGAALIGDDGARISHGCIRLKDDALIRLRPVPAGTPIDIVG